PSHDANGRAMRPSDFEGSSRGAWHRGRTKNAAQSAAERASLQSLSTLPDSKPPVGGRCPAAADMGIAPLRQGTSMACQMIGGRRARSFGKDRARGINLRAYSGDAPTGDLPGSLCRNVMDA